MSNQTAEIESMWTIPGAAGEFEDEGENEKGVDKMTKCDDCGGELLGAENGYECLSCLHAEIERLEENLRKAKRALPMGTIELIAENRDGMKSAYKVFKGGDLEGARVFIDTVASRLIGITTHLIHPSEGSGMGIVVWYWESEAEDVKPESPPNIQVREGCLGPKEVAPRVMDC